LRVAGAGFLQVNK